MSSTDQVGVLQILGEGFNGPLVGLCALAGVMIAVAGRETPPPAPPPPTTTVAPPRPASETPPAPVVHAAGAATAQDLLTRGEFVRAEESARAASDDVLAERAALLHALTRGIAAGPLSEGRILRVVTTDGEVLLGLPKGETADTLTLATRDGRERVLPRAKLRQRDTLGAEAAPRAIEEALRADRAALGSPPPGLALHRLAHQAFASGLRPLGTQLLVEALTTPEGQILVDMFGEGDPERLHAARRRLAAPAAQPRPDPGPEPGPVAALPRDPAPPPRPRPPPPPRPRDPEPEPEPDEPEPDSDPEREPEPEPTPEPSRRGADIDAILSNPKWRAADTAYKTGLDLYRTGFDSSVARATPSVKAALAQFRQAQDLLDALQVELPAAGESYEVERRQIELNALVLDCTKRLGTD